MSKSQNVNWKIISNINEFNKIQHNWDKFIIENDAPLFFHSSFIKNKMKEMTNNGYNPLLITLNIKNEIIAILPFKIKKTLYTNFIEFIHSEDYNPDIFIGHKYVEKVSHDISQFFKKRNKNHIFRLTFSRSSNLIKILKLINMERKTKYLLSKLPGHRILKKVGNWDEYVQNRGGSYRRQFKRIIKKLENDGSYEIKIEQDYSRLLKIRNIVEQRSWKSEWRRKRGLNIVHDDDFIMKAIKYLPTQYNHRIYYLRFNNAIITYVLVFNQKNVVYICKTTYNEDYKNYYPGLLLMNEVVKDMHEDKNISLFDFQTNMNFMSLWTKNIMPHYKIDIIPSNIFRAFFIYSYIMHLIKNTKLFPFYKNRLSPLITRSKQNFSKFRKASIK